MTVYMLIGQYETQYRTDIRLFRKKEDAVKAMYDAVRNLLLSGKPLEIAYAEPEKMVEVSWLNYEDESSEYHDTRYATFMVKEEEVY